MLSSLPLQVCLYFNGWYNAVFTILMLVLYIWKANALPYPVELHSMLGLEIVIVFILCGIEWARHFLGSQGNKTERAGPLIMSTVLSVPSGVAYVYFLALQVPPPRRRPAPLLCPASPAAPTQSPNAGFPGAPFRHAPADRQHHPLPAPPPPPCCRSMSLGRTWSSPPLASGSSASSSSWPC